MNVDHLARPYRLGGGPVVDARGSSLVSPMAGDRPPVVVHAVATYWGWLRDLIKALKYRATSPTSASSAPCSTGTSTTTSTGTRST